MSPEGLHFGTFWGGWHGGADVSISPEGLHFGTGQSPILDPVRRCVSISPEGLHFGTIGRFWWEIEWIPSQSAPKGCTLERDPIQGATLGLYVSISPEGLHFGTRSVVVVANKVDPSQSAPKDCTLERNF